MPSGVRIKLLSSRTGQLAFLHAFTAAMWIGIDRPPRRWVGERDEEAKQIFRRKVDPRHRHRRGGMFRRTQIEIKWGISAALEKGAEQRTETFSPKYVWRDGAGKAGAEKRQGSPPSDSSTCRRAASPQGQPKRGQPRGPRSAGASPGYRTFHAAARLTKLLRDERQQYAQLLECVLKDGSGVNRGC